MTAFQRILINTERWNETVVTPSLAKPHELICIPNNLSVFLSFTKKIIISKSSYFMLPTIAWKLIYDLNFQVSKNMRCTYLRS